ncbi:uncharacterized protein LOC108670257 [Hyalella azteca]|uniref:Uncharacterized protein LOC108670257 n=1 Tax=Hyalella azteca TaxID=294128 RepID=A0A8B7NIM9_HYAAZ|nr:uncharacterized protein LOC108670257 [Hyalella azteca]
MASGKAVHLMRDHPSHNAPILGGMFGVYQPPDMLHVFEDILHDLFILPSKIDQTNLARVMTRSFLDEHALQHSSFHCTLAGRSLPFPTQRQHGFFVGNPWYRPEYCCAPMTEECPLRCRPAAHPDWIYC